MSISKCVSSARSEASRINGAASRGPRTEGGKAISRLNALKFGIFSSSDILLAAEDPKLFQEFRENLLEDLRPGSPFQLVLAETVVDCSWRLERVKVIERDLLQFHGDKSMGDNFKEFDNQIMKLGRHQRSLERSRDLALRQLEATKKNQIDDRFNRELGVLSLLEQQQTYAEQRALRRHIFESTHREEGFPQNEPEEHEQESTNPEQEKSSKRTQEPDPKPEPKAAVPPSTIDALTALGLRGKVLNRKDRARLTQFMKTQAA